MSGELSLAEFYSADAETLIAKYRQLEHLIGKSHHVASEGGYCEALLKEFLKRTLPRRFSVDSGFIRRVDDTDWSQHKRGIPADDPISTPQLDIIIHDTQDYAPLFRSEDVVVVLPKAVNGVIEVKKKLDHGKLKSAVENIGRTRRLMRQWRDESFSLFTGVFAFDLDDDLCPPSKPISDSFKNIYQEAWDKYGEHCGLPYVVMSLKKGLALQGGSRKGKFILSPTVAKDGTGPNLAGQFLLFLISKFIAPGCQGGELYYPEEIKPRQDDAFTLNTGDEGSAGSHE